MIILSVTKENVKHTKLSNRFSHKIVDNSLKSLKIMSISKNCHKIREFQKISPKTTQITEYVVTRGFTSKLTRQPLGLASYSAAERSWPPIGQAEDDLPAQPIVEEQHAYLAGLHFRRAARRFKC